MSIDASIYRNIEQPPSTLQTLGAIQQFQQRGMEIQAQQRQLAAQQQLDQAYAGALTKDENGNPKIDENALFSHIPGHLIPATMEQFAKTKKSVADLQEAQGKVSQLHADLMGNLAATVQAAGNDPQTFLRGLKLAQTQGLIDGPTATQYATHAIEGGSAAVKQITDQVLAGSEKHIALDTARMTAEARKKASDTGEARLAMEAPGMQAKAAVEQQIAAGTQGGINPYQQAEIKNQQQQRAISAGQLAVAQQRERREAASDVGVTLSPQGLDIAAENFAKTGQLPPMGMGKQGAAVRSKIINRAAELHPDVDLASARAGYSSDAGSLKKMQAQRDAIGAFEQTASKNIDIFLNTAGKVVDTGSPMANSLARAVTGKMLGSPDQAAYDAARQVAINEIAKITSNPNLSGTLSDSARHEVDAFNPNSATLKQTVAVMRILKQDMANRTQALDAQLGTIKGRISGKGEATPAATGRFNPATGKIEPVK